MFFFVCREKYLVEEVNFMFDLESYGFFDKLKNLKSILECGIRGFDFSKIKCLYIC